MTEPKDDGPKIHIDTDWKAQAQAEKERLSQKAKEKAGTEGARRPGELPPADFKALVGVLASQALMGLGAVADPESGRVVVDLVGSKFSIDLLGVVEEKTQGNLSDDEQKDLTQVLAELRSRFVQITHLIAQQAKAKDEAAATASATQRPAKP